MGCAPSKLDDLPAVALCRDRNNFLDQGLRQTQALADAHVAYTECLRTLGPSLTRFFDIGLLEDEHSNSRSTSASDPKSGSGHIQFSSDSDSEDAAEKPADEPPPRVHHLYGDLSASSGVVLTSHFAKTPPPPPPPAPISSTWDFLNLFDDMYEKYESVYGFNSELADRDEKIGSKIDGGVIKNDVKKVEEEEKNKKKKKSEPTEKKNSDSEEASSTAPGVETKNGVVEAMTELQAQFEKASECGNEVLKLLSLSHHHRIHPECGFDQLSSAMGPQSLAYTLKTLLLWEKKLYDEVKAEELLRLMHEKKTRMLKQLDKHSPKVDCIQDSLSNLMTRMKIAIQIVDRISITINKLRDEDLWPQIIELIQRLLGMWKAMLECHKLQNQAIAEAKGLDVIASKIKYSSDDHLETIIQLKIDLQNWNFCFSNWIIMQKCCVKALNGWLLRCLLYEPEETEDGAAPFSPGRMGAPPIFVICNQWSQAMDRLSEKEVRESIQGFQTTIDLLMEQQNVQLQQRILENKDLGRKVKLLEELQQKMHKLMQPGRGKKFGLVGGEDGRIVSNGERLQVPSEDNDSSRTVEWNLKQTLMAMEKFTANALEAYEELHARIEEVQHAAS